MSTNHETWQNPIEERRHTMLVILHRINPIKNATKLQLHMGIRDGSNAAM